MRRKTTGRRQQRQQQSRTKNPFRPFHLRLSVKNPPSQADSSSDGRIRARPVSVHYSLSPLPPPFSPEGPDAGPLAFP